jgi:hypothetical protein
MFGRAPALQQAQVSLVHCQDQIELLKVAPGKPARTLRAEIVAAAPGMVLGALVGRLADMIVVGAARLDLQRHPLFPS